MLLNEVGLIMLNEQANRKEVEKFLLEFLKDESNRIHERMVAYSYLSCLNKASEEIKSALEQFRKDESEFARTADVQVHAFKHAN
jgi:hypothetical protein